MLTQVAPWLGYLASLALIIALLVRTDVKFRVYNILGTVFFMAYGIIFHAWPVLLTNFILFWINIYYLNLLLRHHEKFDLIEFRGDEKLVFKFLEFYQQDIARYFPAFDRAQTDSALNFVVLRDLVIANIFSATLNGDTATVQLNYTIKKFRDFKVGQYIFDREKQFLLAKGIRVIRYDSVAVGSHAEFLKVNGFVKTAGGYEKQLSEI